MRRIIRPACCHEVIKSSYLKGMNRRTLQTTRIMALTGSSDLVLRATKQLLSLSMASYPDNLSNKLQALHKTHKIFAHTI
jgi:hypothetical protein